MNFRNYSMDELANLIVDEPDQDRFNDAAKAFVSRWLEGTFYTQDELDEKVEAAEEIAEQKGYDDAKEELEES